MMNRLTRNIVSIIIILIICNTCKADITVSGKTTMQNVLISKPDTTTTVLVYGATMGGISASVALDDQYIDCVLVSSDGQYGGITTNGLSGMDTGSMTNQGGFFKEFTQRILNWYTTNDPTQVSACDSGTNFEPKVAQAVIDDWLDELLLVTTMTGYHCVDVNTTSIGSKTKIVSVTLQSNYDRDIRKTIYADYFIDASYEQDMGRLAGVAYNVGREGRTEYDEWLAGEIYTYSGRGWKSGSGNADSKVQSYNYRLTIDTSGSNGSDFPEPRETISGEFDILDAWNPSSIWQVFDSYATIPNSKRDVNCMSAKQGSDWGGQNWSYPTDHYYARKRANDDHLQYILRLMKHLNDNYPSMSGLSTFKLATDEFTDNNHLPYLMYVRETGRLANPAYKIKQQDVMMPTGTFLKDDPIGLGTYMVDCHRCDEFADAGDETADGIMINSYLNPRAFQIPYRSLYSTNFTNFLTAFGVGATHVGFCAVRMEPTFMHMGQACGDACVVAIKNGKCSVSDISYSSLKTILESQNAILYPQDPFSASDWNPDTNEIVTFIRNLPTSYGDVSWDFDGNGTADAVDEDTVQVQFPESKYYRVSMRAESAGRSESFEFIMPVGESPDDEYIIDETDATQTGTWVFYANLVPFWELGMLSDNNTNKGSSYLTYSIIITEADYYDISVCFPKEDDLSTNFPDNVPVELEVTGDQTYTATWNQQLSSRSTRPFFFYRLFSNKYLPVGTHYFRVKNDGTTQKVGADAIKITESGTWSKVNDVYIWSDYTP